MNQRLANLPDEVSPVAFEQTILFAASSITQAATPGVTGHRSPRTDVSPRPVTPTQFDKWGGVL